MKKYFQLLMICFPALSIGQTSSFLEINNIRSVIQSNGNQFWLQSPPSNNFEVPNGSRKHTIFSAVPWVSGVNSGNGFLIYETYRQDFSTYNAGPVATEYDINYLNKYQRVWSLTSFDVENHTIHWNDPNYTVPPSIKDWPGKGNTGNGERADLAPFFDYNENGIYDPENGDYPLIKGDQAVYFIHNNDTLNHTGPTIEIHGMAYAFASSDQELNNTIFFNYKMFNRSSVKLSDVRVGMFVDMDLGYYFDDFIGCDTTLNLTYTYNGKEIDGNGAINHYGEFPPAQGVVVLNHKLDAFNFLDFNFSGVTQILNIFKGLKEDGSPLLDPQDNIVKYIYPGDPESRTGWSEVSEENIPMDQRYVFSVKAESLEPDESICLELAFPFARLGTGDHTSSVTLLKQNTQYIQSFYNDFLGCDVYNTYDMETTIKKIASKHSYKIFPNPSTGSFQVKADDDALILSVEVFNTIGSIVTSQTVMGDKVHISFEEYPSGVYFIKINSEKGTVVEKVIKQ